MRYFKLFIILFISYQTFSQSKLTVNEIRNITIEVIDEIHLFENRLQSENVNFINKDLKISNDLYFDNIGNKLVDIEDYFSRKRVKYKKKPNIKFKILQIDVPIISLNFEKDSLYEISVKVKKLVSTGKIRCNSKIIPIPADTIIQEFKMVTWKYFYKTEQSVSSFDKGPVNERWEIKITEVKTINPKGIIINFYLDNKHFTSLFKRSYGEKYGFDVRVLDTNYILPSHKVSSDFEKNTSFLYNLKDLNKSININKNLVFNNYDDLRNSSNDKIEKGECIDVLKIPINKYGKIGYFEIGYGISFLSNNLNQFSFEKSNTIISEFHVSSNFGSARQYFKLDYNLYLPKDFIFNLGFSTSVYDFVFSANSDLFSELYNSTDPDGSNYSRLVTYYNYNETFNLNYFGIGPNVGLNYEVKRHNKSNSTHPFLNLFLEYSFQNMICRKSISNRESLMSFSGLYEDFFNILISENGIYDFGEFQVQKQNIEEKKINNLLHSLSIGFKVYPFSDKNLFISSSIDYNYLTKPLFLNTQNLRLSSNSNELNSFFTNTNSSEFRYSSISLSLGMIF